MSFTQRFALRMPRVLAAPAPRTFATSMRLQKTATESVKDGLKSVNKAVGEKIADGINAASDATGKKKKTHFCRH